MKAEITHSASWGSWINLNPPLRQLSRTGLRWLAAFCWLWGNLTCAQTCKVQITDLHRTDSPEKRTYLLTGTATLDTWNPHNDAHVDGEIFMVLQCLASAEGTWPQFYETWDPEARCYANKTGCLADHEVRGSHVRSRVLWQRPVEEADMGKPLAFSANFILPPDTIHTRVVMQYARRTGNPPWNRLNQQYIWELLQEWPMSTPVNIRKQQLVKETAPPETDSSQHTPSINQSPIRFISAQVDPRSLKVELQFPATTTGSLLAASISTVNNPQPFQQVRFIIGNEGHATVNFRAKTTGWDPVNHRIRVLKDGESLTERIIDFSNLNKTGSTKLAFDF